MTMAAQFEILPFGKGANGSQRGLSPRQDVEKNTKKINRQTASSFALRRASFNPCVCVHTSAYHSLGTHGITAFLREPYITTDHTVKGSSEWDRVSSSLISIDSARVDPPGALQLPSPF